MDDKPELTRERDSDLSYDPYEVSVVETQRRLTGRDPGSPFSIGSGLSPQEKAEEDREQEEFLRELAEDDGD